jgi:hypothetical protein
LTSQCDRDGLPDAADRGMRKRAGEQYLIGPIVAWLLVDVIVDGPDLKISGVHYFPSGQRGLSFAASSIFGALGVPRATGGAS